MGTVGSAMETPTPAISRAMSSSTQFVDSEPLMAAQASPAVSKKSPVTMTGRRPMRSETAPAIGEMNMGVAKKGSSRTPAETGE